MHIQPLVLALAFASGCAAQHQEPTPEVSALIRPTSQLGEEVTELDPRIWVIHQAQNGDYWFGSNGVGAYRYDGKVLRHYTRAHGLAGAQVRDIDSDGSGGVLISTNSGVSRFDGERFETLEVVLAAAGSPEWKIEPDDVWIVYEPGERGPCRYDGTRLYELELRGSPVEESKRARFEGTPFKATDIYSIHVDRRGDVWFGTASAGLCRFDGKELAWMYDGHLTTTPRGGEFGIRSIFEDRDGAFWVCNTRQRFNVAPTVSVKGGSNMLDYEASAGVPDAATDSAPNFEYVTSIIDDEEGDIWMACTSDGVLRFDGEMITRYPVAGDPYIATIIRGREGTTYIGTIEDGVFVLENGRFERLRFN